MRRQIRKLRIFLGRVARDVERKITANARLQQIFADDFEMARRLLAQ